MFLFVSNIVIILCFFDYGAIAFTLDCSSNTNECSDTNIECLPNEDCFISCTSDRVCSGSTFSCPLNGDCNIECRGDKACQDSIVNATLSSGNLNILCQDTIDHCRRMKVYGSTLDTNNGDMNMLCNGDLTSCMESEIHCPDNGDCLVSCNADTSCKYAKITGPNNGDLIINCNGRRSCQGATFNGLDSFAMEVSGCIQYESCNDLSLYCPPNTNYTANCFIQGNDNLGTGEHGEGTKIYAVNGWQDVQIDYSGKFDIDSHSGTMFCGFAYDSQCKIAADQWSCAEVDSYCDIIDNNIDVNINDSDVIPDIDIIYSTNGDIFTSDDGLDRLETTSVTLPDLSRNFEHGAMGMVMVGGGLIALALACVICGTIKKGLSKVRRKISDIVTPKKKGYNGTHGSHHIEEIMDQMEPSYDDDTEQHIHHQIQMQTLR